MSGEVPEVKAFRSRRMARFFSTGPMTAAVSLLYLLRFDGFRRSLPRGCAPTRKETRTIRFRRRYAAGAAGGFLAGFYTRRSRDFVRAFLFADLFANWSCMLLAADTLMDTYGLEEEDSNRLLGGLFAELFPPENRTLTQTPLYVLSACEAALGTTQRQAESPQGASGEKHRLSLFAGIAASRVAALLRALAQWHLERGLENEFSAAITDFYMRAIELAVGQRLSREQALVDDAHDWPWYQGLIERKTSNILLCLFELLIDDGGGRFAGARLSEGFDRINRIFFHRQVLDDILDLEEDLEDGQANSLVGMLISQAKLADICLTDGLSSSAAASEIVRSRLIWSPNEGGAPCDHPMLVAALANRATDRCVDARELVHTRAGQGARLRDAWLRGDRAAVLEVVEDSGIVERVFEWVASGVAIPNAETCVLELRHDPLQDVLFLFYRRTGTTYRRCLQRWRGRGAALTPSKG